MVFLSGIIGELVEIGTPAFSFLGRGRGWGEVARGLVEDRIVEHA